MSDPGPTDAAPPGSAAAGSPDAASLDEERLATVRLAMTPGVGPLIARSLLDRFGTAAAVFRGHDASWREVSGVGAKVARALGDASTEAAAHRELARCRQSDVQILTAHDDGYPALLREIPDAPLMLSMRGEITAQDGLAVALVGSRTCTLYGRQSAERLARGLARAGITVISGLARGIDAAAHRGALDAGGRTIAVTAGGLARLYPPEHVDLARDIVAAGAVLTESPLDREPTRGLFPQRNRIISGLSQAIVVVEATRKSGALHTARHAKEQDRDVFAVPGHITDPTSEGCHDLLRDGAMLVRDVDDILEALGPLAEPIRTSAGDETTVSTTTLGARERTLSELEQTVLQAVPQQPTHTDEVMQSLGESLTPSQVVSTLTVLEMRRFVQRHPGGFVVRVPG